MDDLINAIAPAIILGMYVVLLCIFPAALFILLAWVVVLAFIEGKAD